MNTFETFKDVMEGLGFTVETGDGDHENTGEVPVRLTSPEGFTFYVTVNQ